MPLSFGRTEHIHGFVDKRFSKVARAFEKNFIEGFERDGANLAIFYNNKAVVNIWAGQADSRIAKPWTKQTRSILFSSTKALSGLCVALLVDRGYISFDDLVIRHWPEFAVHGKENTTIRQILDHEAGLPYIEKEILFEDVNGNASNVLNILAAAKPLWKPGTATGYHPLTYGWLIDGIVRKADPKRRTLQQFFAEEIAEPLHLDIGIGSEIKDTCRTAYMTHPSPAEYIRDIIVDPRVIVMWLMLKLQSSEAIINKVTKNPAFMDLSLQEFPFNDPKIQQLSIGSATGVSNAVDLARLFSTLINGHLIQSSTLSEIMQPSVNSWHLEKTVIYPIMKGYGFFYEYHPNDNGKYTFGHPGYGCQGLYIDPVKNLVVVYLSNGLKTTTSILCHPYQRLIREAYSSIN